MKDYLFFRLFKVVSIGLIFFFATTAFTQNELRLTGLEGFEVVPRAITYDGGILLTARTLRIEEKPYYLVKLSMEGEELWRIELKNILILSNIIATGDSGFAVTLSVNIYPDLPSTGISTSIPKPGK